MAKHTDPERDQELLAHLDEETLRLLFPERFREPLTITFVYEPLAGAAAKRAAALAGAGTVSRLPDATRPGTPEVERVTFGLRAIEAAHDLFELLAAERSPEQVEILLSGRRVPMVRELWLPLLWNLRA